MVEELRVSIGTRVRIRGELHDADGAPITGAIVTAKAKPPTGALRTDTADEVVGTPGTYETTFDGDVAGRFHVRFESTTPLASGQTTFYVEASTVE